MGKDRGATVDKNLVVWLATGEGAPAEAVRADAERARAALQSGETGALSGLEVGVQLAVVEALVAKRGAAALTALEAGTPYKEVRKAAAKALHTLKTKGVKVEDREPRGEGFRFHTVDGEQPRSYASICDPEGDRMVWLGRTVPGHGRMAFQAVINEATGIGLFQIFPNMTAKIRRLILKELEDKKIPVFEVDETYARWLIEEGKRMNNETGTTLPKEYFQGEPGLGEAGDFASDPHPIYALLMERGLEGEPRAEEVAAGGQLFDLEEVSGWYAVGDLGTLEDDVQKATGGEVIPEEARKEKLHALFEASAKVYFTDAVRARWQRRLLDLAQHLVSRDRNALSRIAVAVGEDLGNAASDATQSPFAMELFYRWYKARTEPKPAEAEGHDAEACDDPTHNH